MSPTNQPKNSRPELTPEPTIKHRSERSRKLHNAKKRYAKQIPSMALEYIELGRANDRAKTQERRAEKKDNMPAERLSDLAM
ncbi:uncharacterized protein EAF02_002725 [Botrytis sinoallii]|uniref:uncharacterized protein n=1 Tax=Botrytis sinoallii TaxID=1463999 RepID=UPI0018FF24A2|nr:uncharacterized protein EAF02_002725 [Botrytis sinoallii]KAF7888184.1 hypothetical protein EAF02_002725 [Botrytis sinoallii]